MPWDSKSARSHTKSANTPSKKHKWARTADAILARTGDEGKAIRIANSVVKGRSKRRTQRH